MTPREDEDRIFMTIEVLVYLAALVLLALVGHWMGIDP